GALAFGVGRANVCGIAHRTQSSRLAFALKASVTVPSEPRVFHGRVAGVVIEAHPGLASVPARGEHLAQRWRARVALFAELVEHHVADRAEGVQPDEVRERE